MGGVRECEVVDEVMAPVRRDRDLDDRAVSIFA